MIEDERTHAHWNLHKTRALKRWRSCSSCGVVQEHKSKYCPNCGAKMDEPTHSKVIETENVQDMYDMGFADKMR